MHGHGPTIHLKRPLGHRWREQRIPISFSSVIIIESGRLSTRTAVLGRSVARSVGWVSGGSGMEMEWGFQRPGDGRRRGGREDREDRPAEQTDGDGIPPSRMQNMICFFPTRKQNLRLPNTMPAWERGCSTKREVTRSDIDMLLSSCCIFGDIAFGKLAFASKYHDMIWEILSSSRRSAAGNKRT